MFSKHPKGLIAAALANMGERFGFYIMMAILTLFISAKFGLSETTTGYIYSAFLNLHFGSRGRYHCRQDQELQGNYPSRFDHDGGGLSHHCYPNSNSGS